MAPTSGHSSSARLQARSAPTWLPGSGPARRTSTPAQITIDFGDVGHVLELAHHHVAEREEESAREPEPLGARGGPGESQLGPPQHRERARDCERHDAVAGRIQALAQRHARDGRRPQRREVEEQEHAHHVALEHAQDIGEIAPADRDAHQQRERRDAQQHARLAREAHDAHDEREAVGEERRPDAVDARVAEQPERIPDHAPERSAGEQAEREQRDRGLQGGGPYNLSMDVDVSIVTYRTDPRVPRRARGEPRGGVDAGAEA